MSKLQITLTCADYARIMPLATGDIEAEGIALNLIHGRNGSWALRGEMLTRAMTDPEVDGGEASMAAHLRRVEEGDRSVVALPIFVLRNFTARDLYVGKDGTVKTAADLVGKRIGMYSWYASGSIWYRHFLEYCGVPLDSIEWWIGDIDTVSGSSYPVPQGVNTLPEGSVLSEMLVAGRLDAMYSPPRPKQYSRSTGPIVRLFSDFRSVEREYFGKTAIFPPQHLIVLRRAVWEQNPWIARRLTDAFVRSNDQFTAAQRNLPYASPWMEAELEDTEELMGQNFYPFGIESNLGAIDAFCDQAHRAGITARKVTVEEYFDEFLKSP